MRIISSNHASCRNSMQCLSFVLRQYILCKMILFKISIYQRIKQGQFWDKDTSGVGENDYYEVESWCAYSRYFRNGIELFKIKFITNQSSFNIVLLKIFLNFLKLLYQQTSFLKELCFSFCLYPECHIAPEINKLYIFSEIQLSKVYYAQLSKGSLCNPRHSCTPWLHTILQYDRIECSHIPENSSIFILFKLGQYSGVPRNIPKLIWLHEAIQSLARYASHSQ